MKRAVRLAIAAAGLLSAPGLAAELPYGASVAPRGASYSKTDAILGGAPSSLAAILASQGAAKPSALTLARFANPYRPLTLGAPRLVPADRPDVFGSVALPVARASLERHWQKVGRSPIGATAAAFVGGLDGLTGIAQLDAVNRYVNSRVQFTDDRRQFGTVDLWLAAADTLRRGKGDCEDYAIAKLQLLRRAGFADKDLYLVILRDVRRSADHAVLVVRAEGRLLVLDNGTNRIFDSDNLADYRPILTFSGNRSWTHGYLRNVEAPVQLAEASPPADVATTTALAAASLPAVTVSIAF